MQRILVVDDNPVAALRLSRALEKSFDAEVVSYTNPLVALSDARRDRPDLVLVDYAMPSMDGIRLIESMRAAHHQAPPATAMVSGVEDGLVRSRAFQAGALDVIRKPFDIPEIRLKVRNLLQLTRAQRERVPQVIDKRHLPDAPLLGELGAVDLINKIASLRDENTGAHTIRMARFAKLIATAMGMPAEETELLLLAAPLHDIGKVAIPDAILLKPGPLTDDEWATMKTHARIGHDLLSSSTSPVFRLGAEIALNHHEQWDGSGYPRGLRGNNIPLAARIVAVCDAFDALTTVRPYKVAWSLEKAMRLIREESGQHFDPDIVKVLDQSLEGLIEIKREVDGELEVSRLLGRCNTTLGIGNTPFRVA